jgi:hypothetical protein
MSNLWTVLRICVKASKYIIPACGYLSFLCIPEIYKNEYISNWENEPSYSWFS